MKQNLTFKIVLKIKIVLTINDLLGPIALKLNKYFLKNLKIRFINLDILISIYNLNY